METGRIVVENVGKKYKVFSKAWHRLAEGLTLQKFRRHHEIWALKDINFTVEPGESVGIIGSNGVGKSTLLRILSGITRPTTGAITTYGTCYGLLDLGVGFLPEFTGRENLLFDPGLAALPRAERLKRVEQIIEFSELGERVNDPIKTYSTGMVMRLGFSLGISTRPEIYFIDEVLAVGDQHFQRRCHEALGKFQKSGGTLLICAHEMFHIRKLCDRVLWIDGGHVMGYGDPFDVTKAYEEFERKRQREETTNTIAQNTGKDASQLPQLTSVRLSRPGETAACEAFDSGETIDVVVDYSAPDETIPFSVGIRIDHLDNFLVTGSSVMHEGFNLRGTGRAILRWHDLQLLESDYMLSVYIVDNTGTIAFSEEMGIIRFSIRNPKDHEVGSTKAKQETDDGIYFQEGTWSLGNGELIVEPSTSSN